MPVFQPAEFEMAPESNAIEKQGRKGVQEVI